MYLIRSGNPRFFKGVIGKLQKIHLYAANISFQMIVHPFNPEKMLFLLFNGTHVFKCIYNNFQKQIVFECPNFGDMPVSPSFNYIVELYNIELSKPIKMAYQLSDECLNPQPIEKTKVGLAVRVFSESTKNAMTYYVKIGHSVWQGTLNFFTLVAKWWKLLNVKSRSKGIRKRDPDSDRINAGHIGNLEFLNKFATWLEEWMISGKSGLRKQTFLSCQQTSQRFPPLVKYLIEKRGLDYVLSGNFQSDPLEKRFGTYRQLSGANYFGSEKQFLEAEKSIRVKSLIKFSKYTMKEVVNILGTDDSKQNEAVELHSETVSDMMLPKSTRCRMLDMDRDIVYYVAGFVARSIKKGVKCVSCGNILGSDSGIEMKIDGISPLECQSFLDMINRGGLIKPSDIVYSSCVVAWDVYSRIMESYEAKSYFLSCKMQRNVFLKVVMIETHANENYTGILEATCINEHSFADIYEKIVTKFFNVMCKKIVSEVNSEGSNFSKI